MHCATRLRLTLKDHSHADKKILKIQMEFSVLERIVGNFKLSLGAMSLRFIKM
ncbi:PTS transporter subunit EIIB [Metabacillus sp. FJAT-53654]|uniref:PTS transporter subunit EIIB n=1 Tax=Metabacillus rhizosphaerae TaxID=3117747 RepID=A0ABZ2MMJ5_9BACI